MEKRWPQNTRAAETFRVIKKGLTGQTPKDENSILNKASGQTRNWPFNTQAARTVRIINGHFRIGR